MFSGNKLWEKVEDVVPYKWCQKLIRRQYNTDRKAEIRTEIQTEVNQDMTGLYFKIHIS